MSSNSPWEVKQIGKVCASIVPGRNKPKEFSGSIPWVTTPEITSRYIPGKSQTLYLSDYWIKEAGAKKVPSGSVVMACVGDLGLVAIATEEVVLNQQLHAFVCPPSVHNEYCAYALEGQKAYMYKIASRTTIPYLNKTNCESIKIPLPPLPEQKAIADLLSTWDDAIDKTERLIQAKERRFKWLLRELISEPRKDTKWKKVKLGDLFGQEIEVEKGKALTKESNIEGDIPVVAGGQTYAYFTNRPTHEMPTVTVSASGAYAGFVWYHDYPIWASDCNVLRATKGVTKFLYFTLKAMQYRVYALQSGGAQPHVYSKDMKNLHILWPSTEEQQQIADTLSSAQREIDLLKQLADKYKTQKRGLMQKMLTGEWRVKPEIVAQYE